MDEYIEREAAKKVLAYGVGITAANALDIVPAADVEPVRHGRWVDRYGGKYANPLYECSECKEIALYKQKKDCLGNDCFEQELSAACPRCRAKMDGGADDAES